MFSKRLKYMRKQRKLSQEELANKINTTKSTISNYENEYSTPSNPVLVDLADALNTSTDFLLGRDIEDKEENKRKDMINKILKILEEYPEMDLAFDDLANMDAKGLEKVYDFIKYQVFLEGD